VDVLRRHGWHVRDGYAVSADPWKYRDYVWTSKAEFSVAKQAYVATRSGWFSGRSACYLAAGKPVIVQDTGFGEHIPIGEGLLTFSTEDEAVDAIERVNREYSRHAAAAARLAREYFDSRRVLEALLRAVLT
jgi:glycosyltransferase involved in cell wall biosynthesis